MNQTKLSIAIDILSRVNDLSEVLIEKGEISEPQEKYSMAISPEVALETLAKSLLLFVDNEALCSELESRSCDQSEVEKCLSK